jgi:DNA-binding IclR family transcriptional regulator
MLIRHRIAGETTEDTFFFPITQDDLADATGLTPPHVNKTLQDLRAAGLVEFRNKELTVLDTQRLRKAAKYESGYQHLNRTEKGDREVSERAGDLVSQANRTIIGRAVESVKSVIKNN